MAAGVLRASPVFQGRLSPNGKHPGVFELSCDINKRGLFNDCFD
jgi:hypothetical protein